MLYHLYYVVLDDSALGESERGCHIPSASIHCRDPRLRRGPIDTGGRKPATYISISYQVVRLPGSYCIAKIVRKLRDWTVPGDNLDAICRAPDIESRG